MGRVSRGDGWELIPARSKKKVRGKGGKSGKRFRSEPPGAQRIRVRLEKRAKGKMVTVAGGFKLNEADLKALAKKLKAHCGAGGKAGGEAIEVQGRHRDKLVEYLSEAGYQVE